MSEDELQPAVSLVQGVVYVRGEVTVNTAARLHEALQQPLRAGAHQLDCSGVTKVDSSIAALLLAAQAVASSAGAQLQVVGLPAAAIKLLNLYDLDGILAHQ